MIDFSQPHRYVGNPLWQEIAETIFFVIQEEVPQRKASGMASESATKIADLIYARYGSRIAAVEEGQAALQRPAGADVAMPVFGELPNKSDVPWPAYDPAEQIPGGAVFYDPATRAYLNEQGEAVFTKMGRLKEPERFDLDIRPRLRWRAPELPPEVTPGRWDDDGGAVPSEYPEPWTKNANKIVKQHVKETAKNILETRKSTAKLLANQGVLGKYLKDHPASVLNSTTPPEPPFTIQGTDQPFAGMYLDRNGTYWNKEFLLARGFHTPCLDEVKVKPLTWGDLKKAVGYTEPECTPDTATVAIAPFHWSITEHAYIDDNGKKFSRDELSAQGFGDYDRDPGNTKPEAPFCWNSHLCLYVDAMGRKYGRGELINHGVPRKDIPRLPIEPFRDEDVVLYGSRYPDDGQR